MLSYIFTQLWKKLASERFIKAEEYRLPKAQDPRTGACVLQTWCMQTYRISFTIMQAIFTKMQSIEMQQFRIFNDRHHWKNHTGCSSSYDCDKYDNIKNVNSQICEQKNRSLRKLSSTLAYCGFNHYMTKVKLFFIMNNFEGKQMF